MLIDDVNGVRKKRGHIVCLTAGLLAGAVSVHAQSYPSRSVRFIVPMAPGGSGDHTSRLMSQKLQALWRQNVVVDNRAGGTGTIALETAANARPDGYTISLCTGSHAARQAMQARLSFDLMRSFTRQCRRVRWPNWCPAPTKLREA
jgi:tripartite-type tricarboxylate transporter receptor subunit TctC